MRERRRYKRFFVEGMDIHAKTVSSVTINIINISLGGVSIVSPKRLSIGGKYSLKIEGVEGDVGLQADVIWEKLSGSRKEPNGDVIPVYTAGLRFRDAMTPGLNRIRNYLEKLAGPDAPRLDGIRFRIKAEDKATLKFPTQFSVKSLSVGGMLIQTDGPLPVGHEFPLELILPESETPLEISVAVASCIRMDTEGDQYYDIGVEFMSITDHDRERLSRFIGKLPAPS